MKIVQWLVLGCLCAMPLAASAQWQWIDKDGRKVFSDQAPPPEIPDKNIVRRPGAPVARHAASPAAEAPDAAPSPIPALTASSPKPSGVDKDLAEKARKAEDAEKAKQAAEAQKLAKARADNCGRARQGKATMDSGIRVARVNAQGEREIMDDKARAAEQQRLQSVIDSDCK
ncbi:MULTISPECIES: DUF4124 domain-containing protein [unclassified Variovorax]|uniref:DUF4124 domain-containing protein n=1 Tax=unclassified Variovorax TaxID=663243 RepID=UPI002578E6B0|nr:MULTISPECIES: DUF4124 domain-containing protein [unclassified Variovorax]MDM0086346.1 DUF4124 domain-containing protein [Variovorax sp. J22G40]MDM0145397.1 DUF4124 domain-containing protein [Variovorax sp. J2P1-31]